MWCLFSQGIVAIVRAKWVLEEASGPDGSFRVKFLLASGQITLQRDMKRKETKRVFLRVLLGFFFFKPYERASKGTRRSR